jgi:hypothetical protein
VVYRGFLGVGWGFSPGLSKLVTCEETSTESHKTADLKKKMIMSRDACCTNCTDSNANAS